MTEREEGRAYQAAETPSTASPSMSLPWRTDRYQPGLGTAVPQGLLHYPHSTKRNHSDPTRAAQRHLGGKACR